MTFDDRKDEISDGNHAPHTGAEPVSPAHPTGPGTARVNAGASGLAGPPHGQGYQRLFDAFDARAHSRTAGRLVGDRESGVEIVGPATLRH